MKKTLLLVLFAAAVSTIVGTVARRSPQDDGKAKGSTATVSSSVIRNREPGAKLGVSSVNPSAGGLVHSSGSVNGKSDPSRFNIPAASNSEGSASSPVSVSERSASSAASVSASGTGIAGAELVRSGPITLELKSGVRLPLAAVKTDDALYPSQIDARQQIAKDFEREIADALSQPGSDKADLDEIWNKARQRADNRFRLLFGDDAYNRASVAAAKEAVSGSNP
jgi:hypothetical protein